MKIYRVVQRLKCTTFDFDYAPPGSLARFNWEKEGNGRAGKEGGKRREEKRRDEM